MSKVVDVVNASQTGAQSGSGHGVQYRAQASALGGKAGQVLAAGPAARATSERAAQPAINETQLDR